MYAARMESAPEPRAIHERVCDAISRGEFSDFEGCLQDECAQKVSTDYIVMRNVDDFKHSRVKAITPKEFLQHIA